MPCSILTPHKNAGWQPALRDTAPAAALAHSRGKLAPQKKARANHFDSRGLWLN
jgi:hypothetical protein